ncbi:MAG: hypothetical protein KC422_05710 [Trueperaceae bacterium]|nr:hypothetical protein [Trueperaceae bacterium]
MGENSFTEVPETIHQMNETELSSRVASMQKRIEQGIASDEDYLEFILCQLELAERGALRNC